MTGRPLLVAIIALVLLPAVVSAQTGPKKRNKKETGTNWTNLDGSKGLPTDPVKAKAELDRLNAMMATLNLGQPLLGEFEKRKRDLEAVAGAKTAETPAAPKPEEPKPDPPQDEQKDRSEALRSAGWSGEAPVFSAGGGSATEVATEEATDAQTRAEASVERARSGGGSAKHTLSGAEAWKGGGDPGAGGPGGSGARPGGLAGGSAKTAAPGEAGAAKPANVNADPALQRALQGGANESLRNFGYKIGPGPSIVHADGRRPTDNELAGLAESMRNEPRVLERRPDFFNVIPRESYDRLQSAYPSRSKEKEFKHVDSDGRDFKWKESCARLGGGCNESSAKESYKRDDFVDPETLRNIAELMKELEANPASTPRPARKPRGLDDLLAGSGEEPAEGAVTAAGAPAGTAAAAPRSAFVAALTKKLGLRGNGPPLPLSMDAVRSGGWVWLLALAAAALGFVLRRRAGAGRPGEDSGPD